MAKYIETYCPVCGKVTTHRIYTEDSWGDSCASLIPTAIFTLGFTLLDWSKVSMCLSCGRKIKLTK